MSDVILQLLVVAVLVLIEAVFVAAEISIVTLRRSRLEQLIDERHRGATAAKRLLEDRSRFLAVVQIGVTFVGFLASAYAAENFADRLAPILAGFPPLKDGSVGVAVLIITTLLAFFTIVFGELVPKNFALNHTDRVATTLAGPMEVTGRVLKPLVGLLTWTTRVVSGGQNADTARGAQIGSEELKLIVERGGEEGVLEAEEEQMISAVIELGQRRVHEVMVPRTDIQTLEATATLDDAIDTIVSEGHSRIPVYRKSIDEVIGILYAKDLLPLLKGENHRLDLRKMLRPPLFVPESMSIDDLLHMLQRRKVHIAIVLDEYGGTAGMVTIEDLIEEIVGEIQDEYDVEEPMTERLSEYLARVDGRASVDDLADLFNVDLTDLEDSDEYDTVGGLIYHRIGGVPRPGDEVRLDLFGLTLTVQTTDGHRVGKILAARSHPNSDGQGPGRESN